MNWEEFFKRYGHVGINRLETRTFNFEQLYQFIKARLMDELVADVEWKYVDSDNPEQLGIAKRPTGRLKEKDK